MVVAVRKDQKTQTRRIVNRLAGRGMITEFGKSNTRGYEFHFRDRRALWNDVDRDYVMKRSPWQVGQIRYVRETWYYDMAHQLQPGQPTTKPDDYDPDSMYYRADGECCDQIPECCCSEVGKTPWRPSIHMPKWVSRTKVEILSVGLEQVQQIDDAGALAEGVVTNEAYAHDPEARLCACPQCDGTGVCGAAYAPDYGVTEIDCTICDTPRKRFQILWDSINNTPKRPYGWDTNCFVWNIGFKRLP
jgi:hypothetical protein